VTKFHQEGGEEEDLKVATPLNIIIIVFSVQQNVEKQIPKRLSSLRSFRRKKMKRRREEKKAMKGYK